MQKKDFLELIENYSPNNKEEIEYKEQIIKFITNNHIYLGKRNPKGHITGSGWIINPDRTKVLLTHHNKLDKWLQLGGHTEEDEHIIESALREAKEESGLVTLKLLSRSIFDIDVHLIPSRGNEEEHYHYDIRFLIEGNDKELLNITNESKDLKWISIFNINDCTTSDSILRMVKKTNK